MRKYIVEYSTIPDLDIDEYSDLETAIGSVTKMLRVAHAFNKQSKVTDPPITATIDGEHRIAISEHGSIKNEILKRPKLREFKIQFNNATGHGLITRKAKSFADLINHRIGSVKNKWFTCWEESTREELTKSEWEEFYIN